MTKNDITSVQEFQWKHFKPKIPFFILFLQILQDFAPENMHFGYGYFFRYNIEPHINKQ